jgi:hypothetical protein
VNGEKLFDDVAKEVLRRQLWQVADYCGVRILTYAIMANHFHVLVLVPRRAEVSDEELLRRHAVLYPKPTHHCCERVEAIRVVLAAGGANAVAWRQRQLARMGDVSQYMKLLKQRFSIWFNESHDRFGTLWAERFKSALIEPSGAVCRTIAAYIDLNCVRAGLVGDPKDYRFCGYAEAVAANPHAQTGLCYALGGDKWSVAQASYREALFGTGASPREGAAIIPIHDLDRVKAAGGRLPLATVLRCRLRYLTDGAVLGSRAFVAAQLREYRGKNGGRECNKPYALPEWTGCGDWATLRKLRQGGVC